MIIKVNELNYRNSISRVVPSRREVINTLKSLNDYRSTNTLNTALFILNYKQKSKIKTLKMPDTFVQNNIREVLKSLEKKVDAAIKRECSLCGPIGSPPSSQATTHGADLPIHFSSAKRWIVLPSGGTGQIKGGRVVIEQTGRYEGPRFVPYSAGKYLHWISNSSPLLSKNCCLLDYLNKQAITKSSIHEDSTQSEFIESISLKLATQSEFTTHTDREDITVTILL